MNATQYKRTLRNSALIVLVTVLSWTGLAEARDPATAADDTWISVSGTVVETAPTWFRLDHGSGVILVEMDDFDFFAEGRQILENDQVIVYGKVDHDLFEKKKIEASSVYVESLSTHFYASAADEEDFHTWTVAAPIITGRADVTGTVTAVDGREFTVDTGVVRVEVDTSHMTFNPMDDTGFMQIEVGDRVKAAGPIDDSLFGGHEIEADQLIKLDD